MSAVRHCLKRIIDFDVVPIFVYTLQLWDFFSDITLGISMWRNYNEVGIMIVVACATFILLPWSMNLVFLFIVRDKWETESKKFSATLERGIASSSQSASVGGGSSPVPGGGFDSDSEVSSGSKRGDFDADFLKRHNTMLIDSDKYDALEQGTVRASEWVQNHAIILVVLCVLSGSVTASLKFANSRLFGLRIFSMGLPRYKQESLLRHRLWLTVLFENLPQIVINVLYAQELDRQFEDPFVLLALISSMFSMVITVLSSCLSYPKHYYIYEMKATLSEPDDNLHKKLRLPTTLRKKIAHGLGCDEEELFVENFMGYEKRFFIGNVVFGKRIEINQYKCQLIKNALMNINKQGEIKDDDNFTFKIDEFRLKFGKHKDVGVCNYQLKSQLDFGRETEREAGKQLGQAGSAQAAGDPVGANGKQVPGQAKEVNDNPLYIYICAICAWIPPIGIIAMFYWSCGRDLPPRKAKAFRVMRIITIVGIIACGALAYAIDQNVDPADIKY